MSSEIELKADFENVEGTIDNIQNWRERDGLVRADLLKDWLFLLEVEYKIACHDAFDRTKASDNLKKQLDIINK